MENSKEKVALNDELLDRIAGGFDGERGEKFQEPEMTKVECPQSPTGQHSFTARTDFDGNSYFSYCIYCKKSP